MVKSIENTITKMENIHARGSYMSEPWAGSFTRISKHGFSHDAHLQPKQNVLMSVSLLMAAAIKYLNRLVEL